MMHTAAQDSCRWAFHSTVHPREILAAAVTGTGTISARPPTVGCRLAHPARRTALPAVSTMSELEQVHCGLPALCVQPLPTGSS